MSSHTKARAALDLAAEEFARLASDPRVVLSGVLDWSGELRLDEVAGLLLSPVTPSDTRDRLWRAVLCQARVDPVWQLVAVGLALPSLRFLAARIIGHTDADPDDVNSELVVGFLGAVGGIDLAAPGVFRRLRAAANAAGMRLVRADRRAAASVANVVVERPALMCRHPDVVLARAVAACVITPGEADLIGATRLESVPVAEAARVARVSVAAVWQRRSRAERRLLAWLDTAAEAAGEAVPSWA
ncbi:hypothetical protein [Phytomonospora endophytica]|uniref:DNA-directed RNA polymerase specialized sigma24 family protein n=1 Tax=Phytomonospora endophytica TaxID=714109 RepID=A0A841FXV6_9ACTN|nr:hypothetical protein [Phytomonospora endophytica]MBB6038548.1 DNA-directed RNA polymerase specialized sigma24 family protein [Phytomonospora endophytica]GIG69312.1 hypothetical protein Pen01_56070 [Phytomonospora endophytica]